VLALKKRSLGAAVSERCSVRASGTYSTFEHVVGGEVFVVPGREQPDAVKALPSPLITNTKKEELRAKNSYLFRAQPFCLGG